MTNLVTKKNIREWMSIERDELDQRLRVQKDALIFKKLIACTEFKAADTIFLFVSFKSEVDTHRLILESIRLGKRVCVPKIEKKSEGIKFFEINSFDDLEEGYYGVLEPKQGCNNCNKEDIDLMVMPGLAFDARGGRIGYGGGFYDRFIDTVEKNLKKVAVAYDFQVLREVPMSVHDHYVDFIITDKRVIKCEKK